MKSQINLYHLKYFCDAASYSSISEASKINFISQSAVSQAITKLESILNAPLIHHSRQKFQLTEEGRIVFEHACSIFNAIKQIEDKISHRHDSIQGTLNFVTTHSIGLSLIAPFYQKMKQLYPHIDIRYQLGNLNFIRNALKNGDAEFAIGIDNEFQSQWNIRPLHQGCFHLYQHNDASLDQLQQGVLVDFETGLYINQLSEYFEIRGFPQLIIQQALSAWEVVARFTSLNIGVGFFPDYLLHGNRYHLWEIAPHMQLFFREAIYQ